MSGILDKLKDSLSDYPFMLSILKNKSEAEEMDEKYKKVNCILSYENEESNFGLISINNKTEWTSISGITRFWPGNKLGKRYKSYESAIKSDPSHIKSITFVIDNEVIEFRRCE